MRKITRNPKYTVYQVDDVEGNRKLIIAINKMEVYKQCKAISIVETNFTVDEARQLNKLNEVKRTSIIPLILLVLLIVLALSLALFPVFKNLY